MTIRSTLSILCLFALTAMPLKAQQAFGPNEFVIGLSEGTSPMNDPNNGGITVTTPLVSGHPSSFINQWKKDGFEVLHSFQPGAWAYSEDRMKSMLSLVKNNGMQFMPFMNEYFIPFSAAHSDSDGMNIYDNNLTPLGQANYPGNTSASENCKAFPNYNALLAIFANAGYRDAVYGLDLGAEHNNLHGLRYTGMPNCYPVPPSYQREVPPQRVDQALVYFKAGVASAPKIKMVLGIASHNLSIHDGTDDTEGDPGYDLFPNDHAPQEYANLTHRPDVLIEASYGAVPADWQIWPYSNINNNGGVGSVNNNRHFLAKFKNIDYLRSKSPAVHAMFSAEFYGRKDNGEEIFYPDLYSTPGRTNANWLWFLGYNSIVHRVAGVWVYAHSMWSKQETDAGEPNLVKDAGNVARFEPASGLLPDQYTKYVAPLARELAFLKAKGALHSNPASILYEKTDNADPNCILPNAASTYLSFLPSGDEHRSENYGLRYSIRTNGTEVYMIVTNPMNATVSTTLNFDQLGNPTIRNATGIQVLFESSYPTLSVVNNASYKSNRIANNVDLVNMSCTSTVSNFSGTTKSMTMAFAPFDVHVFKFVSSPLANNGNGWEDHWSNFGSGAIGEWYCGDGDVNVPADVDGGGDDELVMVQSLPNNYSYIGLLKWSDNGSNDRRWKMIWDNHGSGWFDQASSLWQVQQGDRFIAGDFNGDGKEDILCTRKATGGALMSVISFSTTLQKWVSLWTNGGNTSIGNGIYGCRNNLTSGNFLTDAASELVGVNGNNMYVFKLVSGQWQAMMNNGGNVNDQLYPYRLNLRAGDFDGNGTTDLLGMSSTWATIFYTSFSGSTWATHWSWGESTYGASQLGTWSFPMHPTDSCLVDNLDNDAGHEMLFIQTANNPAWATAVHPIPGGFAAGWSTSGLSGTPYFDDWPLQPSGGTSVRYFLLRPYAGRGAYLMAFRRYGCERYLVSMYEPSGAAKSMELTEEDAPLEDARASRLSLFPNPSQGRVNIVLTGLDSEQQVVFRIVDALGRTVMDHTASGYLNGPIELDLGGVGQGTYIVMAFANGELLGSTRMMVLER